MSNASALIIESDNQSNASSGTFGGNQRHGLSSDRTNVIRPFRIYAKNFFLTYSQSKLDRTDIELFFDGLDGNPGFYAAQEQHKDGGLHWHVILQYVRRRSIRDPRYYDILGEHPRIESCRDLRASYEYLTDESKEGRIDFLASDNFRAPPARTAKRSKWSDVLDSDNMDDFLQAVRTFFPRDYCLNLQRLEYTAAKLYPILEQYEPEFVFSDYHLPQELIDWRDNGRLAGPRPQSLILCGPSRCGKTEWARSLGRHTYWYGQINIDTWVDEMEYLVLDDFSPDITKYLPLWKGFFGAQRELNLTQKYRGIVKKKFGKPCIFLCNSLPILSDADQVWMDANALTVRIYDPLF
jgi:hypothetical protein